MGSLEFGSIFQHLKDVFCLFLKEKKPAQESPQLQGSWMTRDAILFDLLPKKSHPPEPRANAGRCIC